MRALMEVKKSGVPKNQTGQIATPYYMKNKIIDHEKIQARLDKSESVDTITGCLKKNEPQFLLNISGYKHSRRLKHISFES